jgi:hypothetical protein
VSASPQEASLSWLDTYRRNGLDQIEGWLNPGVLDVLEEVDIAQRSLGSSGGVMEIGVHQGRFFTALNGLVADPSIPSLAIDVFDDQELNIDRSGSGNEAIFRENLRLYDRHQGSNVVVIRADSTTLAPQDLLDRVAVRPRIVSVDGGHTPEHTISDIELARGVMDPRGLVFVDDILHADWVGVIEGVVLYLYRRPTLWPVAIGYNKLLLAPMTLHARYQGLLKESLPVRKVVRFCGYRVLVLARRSQRSDSAPGEGRTAP